LHALKLVRNLDLLREHPRGTIAVAALGPLMRNPDFLAGCTAARTQLNRQIGDMDDARCPQSFPHAALPALAPPGQFVTNTPESSAPD
jgi:hypothetical protein